MQFWRGSLQEFRGIHRSLPYWRLSVESKNFSEFVEKAAKYKEFDPLFRQSRYFTDDEESVLVDEVYKFELLGAHFQKIRECIRKRNPIRSLLYRKSIEKDLPRVFISNKTAEKSEYFYAFAAEIVHEKARNDFDRFGYDPESCRHF